LRERGSLGVTTALKNAERRLAPTMAAAVSSGRSDAE
jgi:hypothetical protein